jgi:hypothetical protein
MDKLINVNIGQNINNWHKREVMLDFYLRECNVNLYHSI